MLLPPFHCLSSPSYLCFPPYINKFPDQLLMYNLRSVIFSFRFYYTHMAIPKFIHKCIWMLYHGWRVTHDDMSVKLYSWALTSAGPSALLYNQNTLSPFHSFSHLGRHHFTSPLFSKFRISFFAFNLSKMSLIEKTDATKRVPP